ncbi:MAG: phage major capsid protein [Clostridia bacterium]|nr:phage major capsid protein [Clostridia bacterium]
MAIINRTAAGGLIPVEYSREILQELPQESAFLRLARRLPNMSRREDKRPVLNSLPMAYFVNQNSGSTGDDDIGIKTTTAMEWGSLTLTAEEIACIIPVPENVIADADYDLWAEIIPQVRAAFGVVIDKAAFFGVNKPTSWPTAIAPAAVTAGNTIAVGTNTDLASDIIGLGGLMNLVEEDGFNVNGFYAANTMKAQLRDLRDTVNNPIFLRSLQETEPDRLIGETIYFDRNGNFDTSDYLMIAGDWSKAVYAIREDIEYRLLTEATIIDPTTKNVVYALAQQDMAAMRFKMRLGVQVANPATRANSSSSTRYPFSVLTPAST